MDSHPTEQLHLLLQSQRAAFHAQPFPDLATRLDRLERLRTLVQQQQDAFTQAVSADFGHRSPQETALLELYVIEASIRHTERHLKQWMRSRRMPTALHFLPGHNRLLAQPLGVVGIVSPWNYPVQLALTPAIAALAAGNRVMLKPSELTPRTSQLLAQAVAEHFSPEEFSVVIGDAQVAKGFCGLRFDHLFFTGSTAVGRQVAQAAAKNLVPVTLELGGKTPVIVDESADLALTAERLAYGKLVNAGQTCVAPDYVLAPKALVRPLADAIAQAMKRLYPRLVGNDDYTAILSPRHYARLQGLLAEAKAEGAKVLQPHARERLDPEARKFAPALVLNPSLKTGLMREEIFGPLLPIVGVDSLDAAIRHVQQGERPLALYWFGKENSPHKQRVLHETHAGGVTINDCIWHLGQEHQPFGGVGESGQGAYHGEWDFNTFSKLKPVFTNPPLAATKLFYPPYGIVFQKLLGVLKKLP
jgi:coniferyl-aldehyde dehydrogenase